MILHQLPLDLYPPATNLIRYLADQPNVTVAVVSSANQKNLKPSTYERIRILRFRFGEAGHWLILRWLHSLLWHLRAAWFLRWLRPDAVISMEPHSAIAAWLWRCSAPATGCLLIHHHEYYTPADYRRQGNRLTWLNRQFENRLLRQAIWVSQTNADRLRMFREDHPELTDSQCHVLPNYPPRSWQDRVDDKRPWPHTANGPLRLVYVGSVSLHETYIGPLVEWLMSEKNTSCTLDVYSYNLDAATRKFLENRTGERLRFHGGGVHYDALPETLCKYDVGLILYRCTTINFVYNASNKLFEYLMCGLDVWYPPCMLGVRPYATAGQAPRVLETDFEHLSEIDIEARLSRGDLPHTPWTLSCEDVLSDLFEKITSGTQADPARK